MAETKSGAKDLEPNDPKPKNVGGRPSEYTQEIADRICDQLSDGISLRSVCLQEGMPDKVTVFRWIRTYDEFRNQYARAKEESADAMAEEVMDIADDGRNDWMELFDKEGEFAGWKFNGEAAQRSKLRVDTRKWLMAKMKPKKFGDKLDLTSDGKVLPTPIFGGSIVMRDTDHVQPDQSNQTDIPTP